MTPNLPVLASRETPGRLGCLPGFNIHTDSLGFQDHLKDG